MRFLFFIYLGVAPILLINLLIAMLNRSYADVIEKANTEYELEVSIFGLCSVYVVVCIPSPSIYK